MKNRILTVAIATIITATSSTAFAQENKQNKKARKEVAEAQKDLREAKMDSIEDFNKFKKEAEIEINENDIKIAKLKAKKISDNKADNEKYNKKVTALANKNAALKSKINNCNHTKTSAWTSFKQEFNHDMKELGNAIKDLGVNNKM